MFAIHVGFFWQRPERELAAIRRLLTSDGEFFLFFQALDPGKIEAMIDQATAIFAACGFAVRRVISEEIAGGTIAGVIAQPVGADG